MEVEQFQCNFALQLLRLHALSALFGPGKQRKGDNETGYKNRRRGCCSEQAVNIFVKPQSISKVKILIERKFQALQMLFSSLFCEIIRFVRYFQVN